MGTLHPLELVKSIVDPIHGLVRMTMEEHRVMNHPVFQRLRRIKQNGLLDLVFPSATHTRFEHSLGVVFVADAVLQALVFNSLANRDKLHPLAGEPGQALDLSALPPEQLAPLFRVTRLAALVHDLGHGPLSHSFDDFAPPRGAIAGLLGAPELAALQPLRDVLLRYPKHKSHGVTIAHEVISCLLFAAMWHDLTAQGALRDEWVPLAVACVILGADARPVLSSLPAELRRLIPLAGDVIASAPVDADRMDYMERDSRSCGVSYGLFDRGRILKSALCFRDTQGGALRLGWKLSGLRAIEVFLQARFQLYAQIYYHKTNSAANLMLRTVAGRAREAGVGLFADVKDFGALVRRYRELSDEGLLRHLQDAAELPPELRELAGALAGRRLWKRVYEASETLSARHMRGILSRVRPTWERSLIVDTSPLEATKGLDGGASLLERAGDGRYAVHGKRSWLDHSPILRALHHEEQRIERLYWCGEPGERAEVVRLARELTAEPAS